VASRTPQLAKLTRPRLHRAVARERLFKALDEAREHKPAICVVGPPGAGKTTLVASWLDLRGIKGVWYQIDTGDADLATFFYYLVEAAKPFTRKGQRPLPLLTSEYLQDVARFSRRFFRELFSRLPNGATLVLDNYQEIPSEQLFHRLIANAVEEVPRDKTLFVVSRRDPPDSYARLVANENVSFVDWEALKLTLEESTEIATNRAVFADQDIKSIHEQSGGWVAGLTLILEGQQRSGKASETLPSGRDAIFQYFAAQIFEQVAQEVRQFLAATAFLPQVTVSVAQELTENKDSANILEDLFRRHLFTHRRTGNEATYWYHALFRDFLRARASAVLGVDRCRAMVQRAATLLEHRESFDDAFQLYAEAKDWSAATRVAQNRAPHLLAQGRGQTLRDWALSLPSTALEGNPWLRYWLGTSLIPINQQDARRHLEYGFNQFVASNDIMGEALAAAGILDTYFFEWSDFHPMPRWIAILELLIDRLEFKEGSEEERKIYSGLLVGMLYGAPGHKLLPRVVERVTVMLSADMDANSKVNLAMILLSYCNLACDMVRGRLAVAQGAALIDRPEITPFNQMWWFLRLGYYYPMSGNYEAGKRALDRAIELSEAYGFQGLRRTFLLIGSYRISLAASLGDVTGAKQCYARMLEVVEPTRPMDIWHSVQSLAHVECTQSNYLAVMEIGRRGVEMAVAAGMTYIEILTVEHWATGCAVLGRVDELQEALDRLRRLSSNTCFAYFECAARFLEAYVGIVHLSRPDAYRQLSEALEYAKSCQFEYPQMARYSIVPSVLLAEAIRMGIQMGYAVEVVRRLKIRPPVNAPENWPWPVKVYTLGAFELYCNDEQIVFPGKSPKRPLALLKTLVAFGGRNVPQTRVMDALWPDEEGDAARKSLDITVLRLRRLLGNSNSVLVSDEQITLNSEVCWVDTWAFEQSLKVAQAEAPSMQSCARALSLYRGTFLPAEMDESWTVKTRERFRASFVQAVQSVAKAEESVGQWESAIAHYLRGLEADDLVEAFHIGLMRCYRDLGRPAEGIAAFRRLRQTLSVVLGIAPTAAAQTLAEELISASRAISLPADLQRNTQSVGN
jgi:LuxR family transcriptional regulator, maltose regulon positive regulatory protein